MYAETIDQGKRQRYHSYSHPGPSRNIDKISGAILVKIKLNNLLGYIIMKVVNSFFLGFDHGRNYITNRYNTYQQAFL